MWKTKIGEIFSIYIKKNKAENNGDIILLYTYFNRNNVGNYFNLANDPSEYNNFINFILHIYIYLFKIVSFFFQMNQ